MNTLTLEHSKKELDFLLGIINRYDLPILQNMRITTKETTELTTTNLELSAKVRRKENIVKINTLMSIPKSVVKATNTLTAKTFNGVPVITTPVKEFPNYPAWQTEISLPDGLFDTLVQFYPFISTDETKLDLDNIYVYSDSNIMEIVAVTGHILAYKKQPCSILLNNPVFIPRDAIRQAKKMIKFGNVKISIGLVKKEYKFIIFRVSNTELVSRIPDSGFPNFNSLLLGLNGYKRFFRIDKQNMLEIVEQGLNFFKLNEGTETTGTFHNHSLQCSSYTNSFKIRCKSNFPFRVGFDLQYLKDVIKSISLKQFKVYYSSGSSPETSAIVFKVSSDELRVLMPVRLGD